MTRTKYQRRLNEGNPLVDTLARIGGAVYRKAEVPFTRAVRKFPGDDTSLPYNRETFAGSLGYAVRPVTGEVKSWVATPQAKQRTLRNAICISGAVSALM